MMMLINTAIIVILLVIIRIIILTPCTDLFGGGWRVRGVVSLSTVTAWQCRVGSRAWPRCDSITPPRGPCTEDG
jgi:hypothetical protein